MQFAANFNLSDWLNENGFFHKANSSGELILHSCFNCGKKDKLYISAENGLFQCKVCGITGDAVKLVALLGEKSYHEARTLVYGQRIYKVGTSHFDLIEPLTFEKKKSVKTVKRFPDPITIPHFMKPLNPAKHQEAMRYLIKRGVPEASFSDLDIYVWEFANRVVFPVIYNGDWYGYVARDFTGTHEKKVLNSAGNFRNRFFWNHDLVVDSEELVICEGIFSAIKCGINRSIALLGKIAADDQVELIRTLENTKRVYICLDVDAQPEQYDLYRKLVPYFKEIYNVELPPVKKIRCPACSKVSSIEENADMGDMLCTHCSKVTKFREFTKLWDSADYLDAGDYDAESMSYYISKAKPFSGGGFI